MNVSRIIASTNQLALNARKSKKKKKKKANKRLGTCSKELYFDGSVVIAGKRMNMRFNQLFVRRLIGIFIN